MADTARTKTALQTLYADNTTAAITPQDLRDGVATWMGVYASIYTEGGVTAQGSIGTSYVKVSGFAANGANDSATPDHTNDRITLSVAGVYLVSFSCSFSGSVSTVFTFSLHSDQSEASPGLRVVRTLGTGGDTGTVAGTAILSLSGTEQLEMFVKADGASKEITPAEMQFMVKLIG